MSNSATTVGQKVIVGEDEEVTGYGSFAAIRIDGVRSTVINDGQVYGGTNGVVVEGNSNTTGSVVTNRGYIEGNTNGVQHAGSEKFTLINSGTISGPEFSFRGGSGIDRVINTGTMGGETQVSNLSLGGGNDIYAGKAGHVTGTVFGGSGNDIIATGTENNRISGGSGNDILFGGKGNDTFVFGSLGPTNADVIQDFTNAMGNDDRFELDRAEFTKLGRDGQMAAKLFKDISNAALDADDRVLYDGTTGDLFYDADGSGAGKAIAFAHLDSKPVLTFIDFRVFFTPDV